MKYYHMIIARPGPENVGDHSTRREYISRRQGSHPAGWICLGVCGYHETPGPQVRQEPEESEGS